MEAERKALDVVLVEIAEDPQGSFARDAFLQVLQLLTAVPNVPGKEVFFELGRKMVPLAVELVLFKDVMAGEVLLTHREDEFFVGWHFPGTYRTPSTPLLKTSVLDDAQRCANNEIGGITITRVRQIGFAEHPDNRRFHDAGMLILCDFEGSPEQGEWFSTRVQPSDLIEIHHPYWETVAREQDTRLR